MVSETIETDSKGIPLKHVGYPDQFSVAVFYAIGNIILGSVGLAAAWFLAYMRLIPNTHQFINADIPKS